MQSRPIVFKEDFNKIKFSCKRCGRCCENSKIRLSPYDILRLCKRLSIGSSEFLSKYAHFIYDTQNQMLLTCMLRTYPKCPFLSENGCSVYDDRPYGCRLYPLGIEPEIVKNKLQKRFYVSEECLGFNTDKKISIEDYKKQQKLDSDMFYDPWVVFKIKAINSSLPRTEEFYKMMLSVCYDFDSQIFQNQLKIENIAWPDNIEERYNIIINLSERIILQKNK